ncbi:RIO kinase 2, partial [Phenoliferia sp. Uapishka_3]
MNSTSIPPFIHNRHSDTSFSSSLIQVEQGSKNHELVPTSLIAQISGARSGGVMKALGELAKRKLVAKIQNAKYEGYRLTYGGYDFLACRTFGKRDTVYSVGNQIGTGKESDIYVVATEDGTQSVMKIHRLGRVSFRAIKSKRDYLRKGQSASWMYMSRLAAIKEYAFMKVLYEHDFPVPRPIDQSRHCLLMELIDAFPLRQIAHVPSPGSLYSQLMDLIVRLALSGLIHGDFNEFNILIRDHRTEEEKDRDEENDEDREDRIASEGGDFPVVVSEEEMTPERKEKGVLEPVLIDFPQMVSTDHVDAEYYFNRDVTCIRTFFQRRFKYESSIYPRFSSIMKDGVREFDLDVEVAASGFSKGERKVLEEYMDQLEGGRGGDDSDSELSEEHSDEEDEDDIEDIEERQIRPETFLTGATDSLGNSVRTDALGNTVEIMPVGIEKLAISLKPRERKEKKVVFEEEKEVEEVVVEEEEEDEEEEGQDDEEEVEEEEIVSHRRHRPSTRAPPPTAADVGSIVTDRLARAKKSTERKHHGKKPVSANVLGKGKGSKMKSDSRRAIKDSTQF